MTYGTVIDAWNPFKGIHTWRLRRAAILRLFGILELLLQDERMQTLTFTSDTFHFRGGSFCCHFPLHKALSRCIRWTVYHMRPDIFVSPYTAFRLVEFLLPSKPLRGLKFCHVLNFMTSIDSNDQYRFYFHCVLNLT